MGMEQAIEKGSVDTGGRGFLVLVIGDLVVDLRVNVFHRVQ